MRIRNKILASILTASMVSSMLSGCAGVADVAAVGQAPAEPSVEESAPSEEEIAAEEEAEAAAQNMLAIKAAGYTGLTNLTNENYEDGSYFYEDMTEDGITVITNMCAQAESTADGSVEDYVSAFVSGFVKDGCTVTDVTNDEELSASLTYPTYRVSSEWGSNEDTTWGIGVVIPTDTFTYYYGFSCPADFYEENEAFYDEELKNIELISFEDISEEADEGAVKVDRAGLSLGNNENTGEESEEMTVISDEEPDTSNAGEEKKSEGPLSRDYKADEKAVTAKELAGYWKYDAYDEIYLAIYDSGSYETYDLKSDDLLTEGKFEVNGAQLELTEKGKDTPEILTILGSKRLKDNEGDTLSPYVPVKQTAADAADSSDVTRRYGSYDGYYEDIGGGMYSLKSPSKGVYIKFPSWCESGEGDDYVWASDGNMAYVTGRNVTDEYYAYPGTDDEFLKDVGAYYLEADFNEYFGASEGCADVKFNWGTEGNIVCTLSANLWNDWSDAWCTAKLFVSNFDDGTYEIMLANSFYGYGDNASRENAKQMKVGGKH